MHPATLSALAAAALALPLPALSQDEPVIVFRHEHVAAAEAPKDAAAWKSWAEDFGHEMRHNMSTLFAPRMGPGRIVKGAPYSAQVITETSQTLADGNVISKRTAGAVYRDGEGRTRQETGTEGKTRTIFINDPVANTHFVLSPDSKRATGTAPRAMSFGYDRKDKQVVRLGASEIRVEDGKVFIDGKEASGGRVEIDKAGRHIVVDGGKVTIDGKELGHGDGGQHVIVKRVDGEDGTQREEVRVQVVRSGEGRDVLVAPGVPLLPRHLEHLPLVAPLPPLPGVQTLRFESTSRLGKGVTTSLGMKDFDAVKAEGKATTWTIPAGEIGNRNAITITSETWYSPDLKVTVYSRHSDPRTGESIYRLASIRRGEPAADLFKVPEDYKVKGRAPKG